MVPVARKAHQRLASRNVDMAGSAQVLREKNGGVDGTVAIDDNVFWQMVDDFEITIESFISAFVRDFLHSRGVGVRPNEGSDEQSDIFLC